MKRITCTMLININMVGRAEVMIIKKVETGKWGGVGCGIYALEL